MSEEGSGHSGFEALSADSMEDEIVDELLSGYDAKDADADLGLGAGPQEAEDHGDRDDHSYFSKKPPEPKENSASTVTEEDHDEGEPEKPSTPAEAAAPEKPSTPPEAAAPAEEEAMETASEPTEDAPKDSKLEEEEKGEDMDCEEGEESQEKEVGENVKVEKEVVENNNEEEGEDKVHENTADVGLQDNDAATVNGKEDTVENTSSQDDDDEEEEEDDEATDDALSEATEPMDGGDKAKKGGEDESFDISMLPSRFLEEPNDEEIDVNPVGTPAVRKTPEDGAPVGEEGRSSPVTEGEEERSDAGEETKEGDEDEDEEEEKALGELEQDRSPSSACSTCKLPASFGMVRCTKGDCKNCYHKRCLGIKYKPDCDWICAGCREEGAESFCVCGMGEFGMMIACDNNECPNQWYHIRCVGMKEIPEGAWLCPKCAPPPTPVVIKKKPSQDVPSEVLLKPFEHGWIRELVMRNTNSSDVVGHKPRPADVYYRPPKGRKLRSRVEIQKYLTDNKITAFDIDSFTYEKFPIYKEPYEYVRNAGKTKGFAFGHGRPRGTGRGRGGGRVETSPKQTPPSAPRGPRMKHTTARSLKRPIRYSEAASEDDDDEDSEDEQPSNEEVLISGVDERDMMLQSVTSPPAKKPRLMPLSVKLRLEREEREKAEKLAAEKIQNASDACKPVMKSRPAPLSVKIRREREAREKAERAASSQQKFCGMDCAGQEGKPPDLQCVVCLCLFHPACVNIISLRPTMFVCASCRQHGGSTGQNSSPGNKLQAKVSPSPAATVNRLGSPGGLKLPAMTNPRGYMIRPNQSLLRGMGPLMPVRTVIPTQHVPPQQIMTKHALAPPRKQLPQGVAPMSLPGGTIVTNAILQPNSMTNLQGQLVTLPATVLKQLTLTEPLAVKMNNQTLLVPPSCFIQTPDGVKIFVPPNTFPVKQVEAANLSIQKVAPGAPMPTPPTLLANPPAPQSNVQQIPAAKVSQSPNSQVACTIRSNPVPGGPPIVTPRPSPVAGGSVIVSPSPIPGGPPIVMSGPSPVPGGPPVATPGLSPVKPTNAASSPSTAADSVVPPAGSKSPSTATQPPPQTPRTSKRKRPGGINPARCFMQRLHVGHDCLHIIFSHLNAADLCRASKVCRLWRKVCTQSSMWKAARFRDTKVVDMEKAVKHLEKYNTEHLDLRGLLHHKDCGATWEQLMPFVERLGCLRRLDFGQCPTSIVQVVAEKLKDSLVSLSAEWISDSTGDEMWSSNSTVDVGKFGQMGCLEELKLRGVGGLLLPSFSLTGGLPELANLTKLKQLSLTTLRRVPETDFSFLSSLQGLELLEIGDCDSWTSETFGHLAKLPKLRTLGLTHGGEIPDIGLADALLELKNLEHLELMIWKVADSLAASLQEMNSLKSLSVWPDTAEQGALVNYNALRAVSDLRHLKRLEWGIIDTEGATSQDETDQQSVACVPMLQSDADPEIIKTDIDSLIEKWSIQFLVDKLCKFLPDSKIKVIKTNLLNAPGH